MRFPACRPGTACENLILSFDLRFLVLVRIPITIVAGSAIFAVRVFLVEFRGADKHHSTWVGEKNEAFA